MAQWSRADRTLYAKIVYYGPAFGGKTTNLQALHRITDPHGKHKLLSVKTANDRTLFFDLLPFDLGDILGYQVALKLYTVPGQVRYDTTRQVVLAGSDAIVFVADSTESRQDQNVWSLQNLNMNMRAKRLDPERVPVLYQFNKQDLPEAAAPQTVASWLKVPVEQGFTAVASEGKGVLETFMAASRAMLEKLVAHADERTRQSIDSEELSRQIDRAFEPYVSRGAEGIDEPGSVGEPRPQAQMPVVLQGDDLLERSVRTSVHLGEKLAGESARASRLEKEAEAFRRLSESLRSVGASFDRTRITDAVLATAAQVLDAPVVTMLSMGERGQLDLERSHGHPVDPLFEFEVGRRLLARMIDTGRSCVVEDLAAECDDPATAIHCDGLRAAAAIPVAAGASRVIVAYAPQPDGRFRDQDIRFLSTVAGHLAAGLEKARLHEELAGHRDELELIVARRTTELREAYEEMRHLDQMKDRFLSSLSHEMNTPLTAVISSAVVLRDYDSSATERAELVQGIIGAAETMQRHVGNLLRLVNLQKDDAPLRPEIGEPERLVRHAIELAGDPSLEFEIDPSEQLPAWDHSRLARALANLIDNAVKFSSDDCDIELLAGPAGSSGERGAYTLRLLDRGPGIPEEDRERVFLPFEQGGDAMTSKPDGIGIGLHEARLIVQRHGGRLEYFPRDGGGSEFRITVPLNTLLPAGQEREAAHV